jgi:hypothetical protein
MNFLVEGSRKYFRILPYFSCLFTYSNCLIIIIGATREPAAHQSFHVSTCHMSALIT